MGLLRQELLKFIFLIFISTSNLILGIQESVMSLASEDDIQSFADEVREELGSRVDKVILYGSYARGDYVPGSDVDIAVLVNERKEGDRKRLFEVADDYRWNKDIFFSPRVFEVRDFEEKADSGPGFYSNVSEEGVEV